MLKQVQHDSECMVVIDLLSIGRMVLCHSDVYQHLSQKNGVIAKDAETSSA
jgi:hypothetical protein